MRRRSVSVAVEKAILTAMIVSTRFNQEVLPLLNLDYFKNSFIRKVARWCVEFVTEYDVAPFNHIQDIFNERQQELEADDAELVARLLVNISKRYELDQGINVDYQVDQALRFFKTRELEITAGNVQLLLERGDLTGAERQISQFTKIARVASGWVNPFDESCVAEVFSETEEMFRFPGRLGDFLGGFDRGWLVAIAAGFKKGKTWGLQELALFAMKQRLKVAFFSLEMYQRESNERFYKRLLSAANPEGGVAVYPCFDCAHNQDGSCDKPERTNTTPLFVGGNKPEFRRSNPYRPCTYCRHHDPESYKVAWWKKAIKRPPFNQTTVQQHVHALKRYYGNNYRFKQYPRFSANTTDIKRDLDILEKDDFVPDVIVVDYADILRPEDGGPTTGTEQIDATWKSLSGLAGERRALVVTASQITRAAIDKKKVQSSDMALWIGKLAHVDAFYTYQQTPEEKRDGVMRVGLIAHRYKDFNESDNCVILQKLDYGQAYLDAEILQT